MSFHEVESNVGVLDEGVKERDRKIKQKSEGLSYPVWTHSASKSWQVKVIFVIVLSLSLLLL